MHLRSSKRTINSFVRFPLLILNMLTLNFHISLQVGPAVKGHKQVKSKRIYFPRDLGGTHTPSDLINPQTQKVYQKKKKKSFPQSKSGGEAAPDPDPRLRGDCFCSIIPFCSSLHGSLPCAFVGGIFLGCFWRILFVSSALLMQGFLGSDGPVWIL